MRYRPLFGAALLCSLSLGVLPLSSTYAADAVDKSAAQTAGDAEVPQPMHFESSGSVKIDGKKIEYTAVAGQLLMRNDDGEPTALYGYTAYQRKDGNRAQRPVLFAYNGGPGSASMWLHMGILGPQRTVLKDPEFTTEGPFERVNNEFSVLDVADLVMIDPVGTGFSKAVGKGKGEDFWGVDNDIKTVSAFIARWTSDNNRWLSPKYLLGESYGGMRSGGVAYELLSKHNLTLNGVILVSPFMDYVAGNAGFSYDQAYINFLTTFASTAWYHKVSEYRPDDLQTFLKEAEAFTENTYAPALQKGARLSPEQRAEVLAGLQRFTGISADYWDRANLRIDEGRFNKELLRISGKNVGRIDSRFVGPAINHIAESQSYDPFFPAVGPAVMATFNDYYRTDLGVDTDHRYVGSAGLWSKWDYGHKSLQAGYKEAAANTGVDLNHAMLQNPHMRLMVQQGYFDLATPYGATDYFLDHMTLPADIRDNIEIHYYEAGHMMYVNPEIMVQFKKDIANFIE